ncbi:DUF4148 domain-containing protein [Eoetvoesiella caeni]
MKTSISALTIAISLTSGIFAVAHAQEATPASQQRTQSTTVSEQVKSDLIDWRKAGFDAQSYDALSYDVFGADYQQRYAKYQELRKLHAPQTARD